LERLMTRLGGIATRMRRKLRATRSSHTESEDIASIN
jgi:hypothetical protein